MVYMMPGRSPGGFDCGTQTY